MSSELKPTYIYHITPIQNLAKILESGCLWCDSEIKSRKIEIEGIGYNTLKSSRANWSVPTCKGGFVADYVPFYFATRSPMLFKISRGKVDEYSGGQEPILHLVSKVELVVEKELNFTFTDGHAVMKTTEFYENLGDLNKIDWELMKATYWKSDEDGDMQRRRQAEFLVHNHFPIELIAGIGVISEVIKSRVEEILNNAGSKINVKVFRNWYY